MSLTEWHTERQNKPKNEWAVCITVDDGYLDFWVYVYPLALRYDVKITLFVSPEFVDTRDIVRPNMLDVWNKKCDHQDLGQLGHCSWAELQIMHNSGVIDIQSHTLTHEKVISSQRLTGFYYSDQIGIYTILGKFPHIKPTYMTDSAFWEYIPHGTPIFEECSSVVTRKKIINNEFLDEVLALANQFELKNENHKRRFERKALGIYQDYEIKGALVISEETTAEYKSRQLREIVLSKKILEEKIKKSIEFLCWPHGDNSVEVHELAISEGYLATTSGKLTQTNDMPDRISRVGVAFRNKRWISRQKFYHKIGRHYQVEPHLSISRLNNVRHSLQSSI